MGIFLQNIFSYGKIIHFKISTSPLTAEDISAISTMIHTSHESLEMDYALIFKMFGKAIFEVIDGQGAG